MNLYSIGKEFEAIHRAIDDADGEITEEVEEWLKGVEGKTDEAIAYMAQEITNLEAHAAMIAKETARLTGRAQGMRGGAKRLRDAIYDFMKLRALKRTKTLTHTISISVSTGVELFDLEAIEATGMIELVSKPDKKAIKEALKKGLDVPGARLVSTESVRLSVGKERKEDDDENE